MCAPLSVDMDWDKSKEKYWSFQDRFPLGSCCARAASGHW